MGFIGRCGTYRDLDMDQVINESLSGAEKWLKLEIGASKPPIMKTFGERIR